MGASRSSWSIALLAVVSFCLSGASSSAMAQTAAAAPAAPPRLPAGANAMLKVEVSKILQSPLAKELGWQAKMSKGHADRPLAVPPGAKRMTVFAGVNPVGMHAVWQAALVELSSPPRLEPMLKAQGGYLDEIGGKKVAWTSHDVFYVHFDSNTLGVLRPGQRQLATRWITGKSQPQLSAYLKNAWTKAAASTEISDVIFVMDTDDLVSATAVHYADSMGQFPSLEKMEDGRDKLLAALGTVQGVRLTLNVKDSIQGEFVVDFDQDVTALGAMAKPFVLDVMRLAEVYEPTMDQWQFKAQGKQIAATGKADHEAIARLLAMMSPPRVEDAAGSEGEPAASGDATPDVDPKQAVAYASQQYYKYVAKTLDTIGTKSSPTQVASWFIGKARNIEQLPILNVDPALVAWGNTVTEAFNRAAQELSVGQQKAQVAAQGVASPTAYTNYAAQGGGGSNPETRAAYRNAQQQRRQVSQAERGAAADRAFAIMNQVLPTRGKVRAEMTQKYGVEF